MRKLLPWIALLLMVVVARSAHAGSYLVTAALLLDETRRGSDWVLTHSNDPKLAAIAHQLSEARVKCGRAVEVPKEAEKAHPHLLLALESSERALAALLEGESERFVRLVLQAREEERLFRVILGQQRISLPDVR
jgi:hypothetical protein